MNQSEDKTKATYNWSVIVPPLATLLNALLGWVTYMMPAFSIRGFLALFGVFLITLSLTLLYRKYKNTAKIEKNKNEDFINLLEKLAERKHIHTLRMAMLIRKRNVNHEEFISNVRAAFRFSIVKGTEQNTFSTIRCYTFSGQRINDKAISLDTYLFSENVGISECCITSVDGCQSVNLELVGEQRTTTANDGISRFGHTLRGGTKGEPIDIELSYKRINEFNPTRDHDSDVLIVYPRSFLKGIKHGEFVVECPKQMSNLLTSVRMIELSGEQSQNRPIETQFKKNKKDGLTRFICDSMEIHEESVYVIQIDYNNAIIP